MTLDIDRPDAGEDTRLRLRNLRPDDHDALSRLMERAYSGLTDSHWSKDEFVAQLNRFPEGQLCIEDNGDVVAAALTLIVNYSRFGDRHTYDQITGNGYFTTHDPNGDVLYGVTMPPGGSTRVVSQRVADVVDA